MKNNLILVNIGGKIEKQSISNWSLLMWEGFIEEGQINLARQEIFYRNPGVYFIDFQRYILLTFRKVFFYLQGILYWNPRIYFLKSRKIFYWLSRKGFVEEGRVSLARGQILLNSNLFPRPAPNSSPKPFQFAFSSIIYLYCCL